MTTNEVNENVPVDLNLPLEPSGILKSEYKPIKWVAKTGLAKEPGRNKKKGNTFKDSSKLESSNEFSKPLKQTATADTAATIDIENVVKDEASTEGTTTELKPVIKESESEVLPALKGGFARLIKKGEVPSNGNDKKRPLPKELGEGGIYMTSYFNKFDLKLLNRRYVYGPSDDGRIPNQIIDVTKGVILKYDFTFNAYFTDKPIRKPIHLTPSESTLYYLYLGYMLWNKHRTEVLTEESLRLLESSITLARCDGAEPATLLNRPEKLLESPLETLYDYLEAMKGKSSELIIVSDNLKEAQYAVYTGSVPPFRYITDLEMNQFILSFLKTVFNDLIPGKFGTQIFIQSFKELLVSKKGISTQQFNSSVSLVGMPFKNGFAKLVDDEKHPMLVKYSNSVFVTGEVVEANYFPSNITNKTIMLSEPCKRLLENICMNDPYIYSAIRGTLRTIITAPIDGDIFQSALWLCGPPGCSKSAIADLFKRFVPKEYIAEFAHTTNQFTGSSLANKRLIIFSDTVGLSQAQFQMIKPLLGRDAIRSERKNLNEVTTIYSKAAIVFVSNFHVT